MSRRGLAAGLVLAAAAAVLAAALLWMARTTLKLESSRAEALRLAAREEKVRLSLWRMDSALTARLGRENALAAEPFGEEIGSLAGSRFEVGLGSPGQAPEDAPGVPVAQLAAAVDKASALSGPPAAAGRSPADRPLAGNRPGAPALPAPPANAGRSSAGQLLTGNGPGVPGDPAPADRRAVPNEPVLPVGQVAAGRPAPADGPASTQGAASADRPTFGGRAPGPALKELGPPAAGRGVEGESAEPRSAEPSPAEPTPGETGPAGSAPQAPLPESLVAERRNQMVLNSNEFYQRLEAAEQQNAFLNTSGQVSEPLQEERQPPSVPPPATARPSSAAQPEARQPRMRQPATLRPAPDRVETTFHPVWSGDDLYLVRRVRRGGELRLQGIRLDWPGLRASLLGDVRDLLPRADLLPIAGEAADPGRRLALLPVRLVPGALAVPVEPAWTPARLTVAAASGAIALAAAVVALLLLGSLQQSRRRADFVSAVTHELRTPLTTLRMYTEMLSGGMVAPGEQGEYLATLSDEAGRLGHLVENVLAYSRLERRPRIQPEAVGLEDLLADMAGRLGAAAARGGFELAVHPAGDAAGTRVLADRDAVERILLNWVDNACKYAAVATDRRLEIQPLAQSAAVVLRLRDHGPGIPREERRRIFRPFHKSAHRAAATAPGVGLGLTLSRRLARSLGGDLRLADPEGEGAAFDLHLRTAPPG